MERITAAHAFTDVRAFVPTFLKGTSLMPSIETRRTADGTRSHRVKVRLKGHVAASATFARLTDGELAAVITYTRSAWGNKAGEVMPSEVKAARKG